MVVPIGPAISRLLRPRRSDAESEKAGIKSSRAGAAAPPIISATLPRLGRRDAGRPGPCSFSRCRRRFPIIPGHETGGFNARTLRSTHPSSRRPNQPLLLVKVGLAINFAYHASVNFHTFGPGNMFCTTVPDLLFGLFSAQGQQETSKRNSVKLASRIQPVPTHTVVSHPKSHGGIT